MNFISRRISYLMNPGLMKHTENVFQCIAKGREKALYNWFDDTWISMRLSAKRLLANHHYIKTNDVNGVASILEEQITLFRDFSELFICNSEGKVLASTFKQFIHQKKVKEYIHIFNKQESYMYGPFIDDDTVIINKSNSKFFDAVTLMFIEPLSFEDGIYFLCGRVPNDVMSDVLQDEDSHVYKESGDNYLFMVKTSRNIPAGTAISRSRFEDNAFTLGDNLKDGIKTKGYGTVQIKKHTEFEIIFNDPATQRLHEGVQNTIDNGKNLEAWPGYTEYRHILVGGQGIIINPPNTEETWGLLCEGDIDEIYKYRSLNIKYLFSLGISYALCILLFEFINSKLPEFQPLWSSILWFILITITLIAINRLTLNPLKNTIDILEEIAEGEGDLSKRVRTNKQDQIGELSRWFNKFVNNQMNIVSRIRKATFISKNSVEQLGLLTREVNDNTNNIFNDLNDMLSTIESYTGEINNLQTDFNKIKNSIVGINDTMASATQEMASTNENAIDSKEISMETYRVMDEIVNDINGAINSMNQLKKYSQEITGVIDIIAGISNKTKLLALNASIEAARAGEHGRGFAVVADDIGVLASQTIESTRKISEQIKNIQNEVNENTSNISFIGDKIKLGSSSVNKTIDAFSSIQKDIEEITNSFESISAQMSGDTTLIENILNSQDEAVTNFEKASQITKVNCANMLDTLKINNLKMQQVKDTLEYTSSNMFNMVNEFKID